MKNSINRNKKYLILAIIILYFTIAFKGSDITYYKYDRNTDLAVSTSFVMGWNRTWGGVYNDVSYGVAVDSLDNIYLAGETSSFGEGQFDMVLVKYDKNGVLQWNRTWGGTYHDFAYGVAVDSSNNIYLAGHTENFGAIFWDIVLVKYDSSGVQLWNRTWGEIDNEFCFGIVVDSFNNVYLAGVKETGVGTEDMVLVKFDSSGIQLWNRTWGGSASEYGLDVTVDSSDNVYLVGGTESYGAGSEDIVLLKYDSSGVLQWNRTWGGSDYDYGYSVSVDSSDNVYRLGDSTSFGDGDPSVILLMYSSSGVLQWNRTWGRSVSNLGLDLVIDSLDNLYVVAEFTGDYISYESVLIQYDNSGTIQWEQLLDWNAYVSYMALDSFDIPILAGATISYGAGLEDMFLAKLIPDIYAPIITINNPLPNEEYVEAPDYDLSIVEPNLVSIWYTINGGLTNYTITELSGTINQTAWGGTSYGSVTIEFWAKDVEGNIGHSEVIVEKVLAEAIPGYNLLFLISAISIITVIYLKNKQK
jgi:hypothetical protein